MNRKVCMAGAAVLVALVGFASFLKHDDVSFTRLQDAKARLAALGYFCTSDSANGQINGGFMISRNAVPWNEVGHLCKVGPMGPEWEGRIWVTLNPEFWQLESVPDQAGVRVWGAVVAFGDEKFLHEIEEAL